MKKSRKKIEPKSGGKTIIGKPTEKPEPEINAGKSSKANKKESL